VYRFPYASDAQGNADMGVLSAICGLILAVYLGYESAVGLAKYRRLKRDIAGGNIGARSRFYWEILIFEWLTALLAFAALEFDVARLAPSQLKIGETALGRWCASAWSHVDTSFLAGIGLGAVLSMGAVFAILWRARRQNAGQLEPDGTSFWKRLLPDISALVPTTARERVLFALVAVSAGICEEIVYRAWLLDVLHGAIGFGGFTLVGIAAVVFGLGHYYQGIAGILLTSLLGLVFCWLYIASGTLLVPIVIHAAIDLRFALLPSGPSTAAGTSP
jgi:uncharacterized protein